MRNIAAWTDISWDYPAYISINEEADNQIILSVRPAGDSTGKYTQHVVIGRSELHTLALQILRNIDAPL